MRSKKRHSVHEYFAIAASIKYSTTMQKALDAIDDMPDDPKHQSDADSRPSSDSVTPNSADDPEASPKKTMIGAE